MRNRAAKRRLLRGTLNIHMNPLRVIRCLGKQVDPILGDRGPLRYSNLSPKRGLQRLYAIKYFHCFYG